LPVRSACFRYFDRYAHLSGGDRQAPIELDEGRVEAPGNRQMQGVRRSEPQIAPVDRRDSKMRVP